MRPFPSQSDAAAAAQQPADQPAQSDEQPGNKFGLLKKKKSSFIHVVRQASAVNKAKRKFNDLSRPRRPPFPGTATPLGLRLGLGLGLGFS